MSAPASAAAPAAASEMSAVEYLQVEVKKGFLTALRCGRNPPNPTKKRLKLTKGRENALKAVGEGALDQKAAARFREQLDWLLTPASEDWFLAAFRKAVSEVNGSK